DAHLPAGCHDTYSNFAPVGDQYFCEHVITPSWACASLEMRVTLPDLQHLRAMQRLFRRYTCGLSHAACCRPSPPALCRPVVPVAHYSATRRASFLTWRQALARRRPCV